MSCADDNVRRVPVLPGQSESPLLGWIPNLATAREKQRALNTYIRLHLGFYSSDRGQWGATWSTL